MKDLTEDVRRLEERVSLLEKTESTTESLQRLIAQIANTIPERFRPQETDWVKDGAISKALNTWAESLIQKERREVGQETVEASSPTRKKTIFHGGGSTLSVAQTLVMIEAVRSLSEAERLIMQGTVLLTYDGGGEKISSISKEMRRGKNLCLKVGPTDFLLDVT